ncbi:THO2 plays a role in transcriptional elongation [Purpureocillium takamizusanense]|uniref:THO complex subunit 2 n=1 Tax=Purpureocillium takamizusanense TaxID=2060973 RepID=A0A9Q8V8F3_9HYPO|nr:THO2 plays a role in transcriptional elongation [Purpureocillium takamizusanense]UNI16653.1 THO2 plays a role in transcriptional elongation [Purpureocillium takamizusanense]
MPPKRKRPDRPSGEGGRPSPHRPSESNMGQHDRDDGNNRAGGRPRGGHRGGSFQRRDSNHGHGRRDSGPGQNAPSGTSNQQTPTPSRSASISTQGRPLSPTATKQQKSSSSPALAKQAAPSPANAPALKQPAEPDSPSFYYENLTDDRVRAWKERGRQEIIAHGIQSREDVDITEISTLFQEFIHAVIAGRIDAADAGACVKDILGEQTSDVIKDTYVFAPHSLFLDTLSVVMDNNMDLYRPTLRDFLIATAVSPALMREVLDAPLLQQLGLIRDTFARLGVRQATNLLYRQANYNLLREESEGYSKLITELFSTNSVPPPPPGKTFEKIKALIGTFDLDVGRTLDVTLDVSAAVLIKQFKFFVKFLRISSWWPSKRVNDGSPFIGGLPTWAEPDYPHWSTTEDDEERNAQRKLDRDTAFWDRAREVHLGAFFELGGRRVTEEHLERLISNGNDSGDATAVVERKWMEETKTLPAPGNRVAAQLLGFKLRFYNSEMRDKTDVLPANLLYLAALLIKIGFLSLTDLYPHLSPDDTEMDKVREQEADKLAKEEQASRGGQMNALLMAGVLPQGDDDNPAASSLAKREPAKKAEPDQKKQASEVDEKNKLPAPLEQKVALLIQLLTIGALPESLFLIGRFPWVTEVCPEVLQRVHRILHVCLSKVHSECRPLSTMTTDFPTKNVPDIDQTGMPKGSVRLHPQPLKKSWRWPFPDKADTNDNQSYHFYWDEWSDNVPVCQTVDDVFTLCNTLLNISGVNIGKDEVLLSKLASIGAKSLAEDQSDSNRSRWQDLIRRLLLPALSHTKANGSVVSAVWDLVRQFPLTTRYSLYAEWFEGQTSRLPAMKLAFAKSASETRATMKRVSLTNLSEMAKRLAKTSYASPGIVFKVAFEQLEVYSNLIEAFVECAKYFTDLSYDVLVWSLMNSLGKSRSRTQENHALTTSKWLQALSRFCGKVFRRYPTLDPIPVLKYVDEQLFHGNSTDLIILKEFVTSMGGIVDAVDFTDDQILGMAGGALLRRQTLIRAQDKRFENIKSSARLMQALSESKLAARLLINLAQYRQAAIYRVPEDEAHIKYLSSIIDDSQQTLIQYLDFLWSNLDAQQFDAMVPSLPALIKSFGLSVDVAFMIGRASLAQQMFPWKPSKAKRETSENAKPAVDKEGDVNMSDAKPQGSATKEQTSTETVDLVEQQKTDDTSLSHTASTALQPIVEAIRDTVKPEVWEKVTPELYSTFWALQLGDLCFPEKAYVDERNKLMAEWHAISNDRSDMTRRGLDRKAQRKKELMDTSDDMIAELSGHGLRKAKWKFYLTKQFQASFPSPDAKPEVIADILLEYCVLPRVRLSPADAEYTYRFIKALHEWNAPVFRYMAFLDRLLNANRLRTLIFTCTVREAENLGRFLNLILEDLSRWHKNVPLEDDKKDSKGAKDTPRLGPYDKEAKGPSDQPRLGFALTLNEQGKPETFVEHAQFRDMLFRWHKNINTALKNCLGGSEWMHIRNAITVLKAVLNHFPAVDFMASQFTTQLQKITKREAAAKESPDSEEGGRVDLSVAAQGAMSQLQQKKGNWMMVQAFRSNAAPGRQSEADNSPASRLRATAPDFKPNPPKPSTNRANALDEEDGEVRDGRDSKGQSSTGTPKEVLPSRFQGSNRDSTSRKDEASGPSRSSTPRPGAGAGAGAGQAKPDSRGHKLPDRPTAHNLPSRPDVPIPTHVPPERFGQSRPHERRDARDTREQRPPRELPREGRETREQRDSRDRPIEQDRPVRQPREHPDRRPVEGPSDVRHDLPPRPGQHERERPHREPRVGRLTERHDEPSQPAQVPSSNPTPEPAMNPERAALFAQDNSDRGSRRPEPDHARGRAQPPADAMEPVNPGRAALIDDRKSSAQMPPSRLPRDEARDRGPRQPSPGVVRYGVDQGPPRGRHDDRVGRPFPQDPRGAPGRDPRDRSPVPSGGFRGERPGEREGDGRGPMEPMRDASNFPRAGLRGPDPEGRLPHQDQNYGRLNPIPSTSDIPSGPRGRGRNFARGGHQGPSGTPGRADGRLTGPETPRPPSPDRLPPTGPASGRNHRSGFEHGPGPATPSGTPGGPHSDRKRNFGPGPDFQTPTSANATPTSGGVHPDRLAQMGPSVPSHQPPAGPPGHGGHNRYSNASDRPMPGHRGSMGPPPAEGGVPTGPSSVNDRPRGGSNRRQLVGINNMLQQSQGAPEMGRMSGPRQPRQLLGNSDAQVLTGGSPATTPGQERQDMGWPESANRGPANGAEGPPRREHRGERDSRTDRPSRSSRRSSRERERSPRPPREGEPKEHRDYRDRRSMGGPENMVKERGRDGSGRDTMGLPPPGARDAPIGREAGYRGHDRSGGARLGDEWATGGSGHRSSGRGGPRDGSNRPPEERREVRDDRGHKRRSEEGVGNLASEREKRPRRG